MKTTKQSKYIDYKNKKNKMKYIKTFESFLNESYLFEAAAKTAYRVKVKKGEQTLAYLAVKGSPNYSLVPSVAKAIGAKETEIYYINPPKPTMDLAIEELTSVGKFTNVSDKELSSEGFKMGTYKGHKFLADMASDGHVHWIFLKKDLVDKLASELDFMNMNESYLFEANELNGIKKMTDIIMNSRQSMLTKKYEKFVNMTLKDNKVSKIEDLNPDGLEDWMVDLEELIDDYGGQTGIKEYVEMIERIEQLEKAIKDSGNKQAIGELDKLMKPFVKPGKTLDDINDEENVADILFMLEEDDEESPFLKYGIKMPKAVKKKK